MTLMKAILGLCLGLALMAALQTAGVWSLQEHIKSQSNTGLPIGNTPIVGNFDADTLKKGILPNTARSTRAKASVSPSRAPRTASICRTAPFRSISRARS